MFVFMIGYICVGFIMVALGLKKEIYIMRVSGIGTTLLGIGKQDDKNIAAATLWFTFIFLPLFPLGTRRIQFFPHRWAGFAYKEIKRLPLDVVGVIKSYLFGWIVFPALFLGPVVIAIQEIWTALGLPPRWHGIYIFAVIAWMVGFSCKLSHWHERRGAVKHLPNV